MLNVAGIKFRQSDKIYYFDFGKLNLNIGDTVIVETFGEISYRDRAKRNQDFKVHKNSNTIEIGIVKNIYYNISEQIFVNSLEDFKLRKILRIATNEDILQDKRNRQTEKEAFTIFIEKAKKHKLKMKLIDVQISFDFNKVIFLFTSDGRVDFRELVKELAFIFKTRIELRQVGVRDETKALNGIGICGRTLCCSTFLNEFQPVSIKMAKDQNISLNPTKISGICGRLMCCLKYEQETYEEFSETLPNPGDVIKTSLGVGEVISSNILKQVIKAAVRKNPNDTPNVCFFNIKEVEIIKRKKLQNEVIDNEILKEVMD